MNVDILRVRAHAVFLGGAFAVSLFFIGVNAEVLCLALLLLAAWGVSVCWQSYGRGLQVPRSALALAMILFPLWLALSIGWSLVPSISHLTFWWVSTGALTFWLLVLDPRRDQVWPRASLLLLVAGLALAGVGYYQRFVSGEAPSGPFLDRNLYAALLILIALPLAGRFLAAASVRHRVAIALGFAALVFAIALTQSRAGMVTFAAGALVLTVVAWHPARKARLATLGLIAVAAFAVANMSLSGGVIEKLATLQHPHESGHTRFLIWEATWRMIAERPWLGIGLGTYPLLWPPYRHSNDASAGYFAHNDYLQVWVDTGLPGLILFLAPLAAAAWMIQRLWRRTEAGSNVRAELAGLAAGFVALPVNSVFNYNFYVIPSLIAFGMLLARLQMLDDASRPRLTLPVARVVGRPAWRLIVLLLVLLPVSYFASVAAAALLTDRAVQEANRGEYQASDTHFTWAHRLWPSADAVLTRHAELYHYILGASRTEHAGQRAELFGAAVEMLDEAERLNPFRSDVFVLRAELLRANPQFDAESRRSEIERNYRRALALDPWHYRARYRLAGYLVNMGATEQARTVLEAGISRASVVNRETLVPYLFLTAKLREEAGDRAGVAALRERAQKLAADKQLERLRRAERRRPLFHQPLLASF